MQVPLTAHINTRGVINQTSTHPTRKLDHCLRNSPNFKFLYAAISSSDIRTTLPSLSFKMEPSAALRKNNDSSNLYVPSCASAQAIASIDGTGLQMNSTGRPNQAISFARSCGLRVEFGKRYPTLFVNKNTYIATTITFGKNAFDIQRTSMTWLMHVSN